MSKYDFKIDLSKNTSTGLIIDKIVPNSIVLEFGCANGRMTKYLKENLNCKVYIVEIDKDAYNEANKYAEDGLCGDISEFKWYDKFKNINFDYAIFADVLEHLTNAEEVLKKSGELLNENGKVLISIPNITNNDIILKMYKNHFDYTNTGLLDNTHVHFWGLENIPSLVKKANLYLENIEGTIFPTGHSEQFDDFKFEYSNTLLNILKKRSCGEIYQFIITIVKKKVLYDIKKFDKKYNYIISKIYLDTGNGFDEKECMKVNSLNIKENEYSFKYIINKLENIKEIRIDPIEDVGCIINNINIIQNNKKVNCDIIDSINIKQGILILSDDPKLIINGFDNVNELIIEFDIILNEDLYLNEIVKLGVKQKNELNNNNNLLNQVKLDLENHKKENKRLTNELNHLNEEYDKKITELNGIYNSKGYKILNKFYKIKSNFNRK